MPALTFADQQTVKYHLGYSEAISSGDHLLIEQRMNNIRSTELVSLIKKRVERCTEVGEQTQLNKQTAGISYNRILTGDVNRTDREDRSETRKSRMQAYMWECDQLALELGVLNYRSPTNQHLLHYGVVQM
jgi:hypothetical protein